MIAGPVWDGQVFLVSGWAIFYSFGPCGQHLYGGPAQNAGFMDGVLPADSGFDVRHRFIA